MLLVCATACRVRCGQSVMLHGVETAAMDSAGKGSCVVRNWVTS